MRRPQRLCAHPMCGELTGGKYCDRHKPIQATQRALAQKAYDAARDPELAAFYRSPEWETIRRVALMRDKGLCQHCLKAGKITYANTVHHIVEVRDDWSKRLDLANLVSLCHACHNKIHKG